MHTYDPNTLTYMWYFLGYNVYDKPLFAGSSANTIYRPKKAQAEIDDDMAANAVDALLKAKPHKGFKGADEAARSVRPGPRCSHHHPPSASPVLSSTVSHVAN